MKNILFATLAALIVFTSTSKAVAADELQDLIKCRPTVFAPEIEMSLTLSSGGIAGLTMITVERLYMGRVSSQSYIVRQISVSPEQMEQPVLFLGEDISFEADFGVATTDGYAPGLLKLRAGTNDFSIEELSCAALHTNPAVNYVY